MKSNPYTKQIGPTCGFYCIAYVIQCLKNGNQKPSTITLHKEVYNLIKEYGCETINGRPITYVGEIFDIDTLSKIVKEIIPDGYSSRILKFDQDTFYDSQECLYYIVPIQNTTPHFVVVENITEVKADVWDPNSFCSHISYEPDKLISKNNNILCLFDWKDYVSNHISPSHKNFSKFLERFNISFDRLLTSLLFRDFVKFINSREANCASANKEKITYNADVNLNGYIIGISKIEPEVNY